MDSTFPLGRIAGIRIGMNWSVLVVAWLLCWGLATEGFPVGYPGHSPGAYWVAGLVTALLFFASLVAHELGHSIVARHLGVQVTEITLWMLGGVAKLEGEATRATDELRIAVVGPAVSALLGLAFGFLAGALGLAGAPELVVAVPAWLASINLLLAVFNLLPAFPMDGGRVFRAWLWKRHGDKRRATRAAAAAGRGFGWALMAVGLLIVTGGGGLGGLWFGLIGLYLVFASRMEATHSEQAYLLRDVTLREVMTPDPICAPAEVSVQTLLDHWVMRHHVSSYPVTGPGGRIQGLVTLRHLRAVAAPDRPTTTVGAIAAPLTQVPVAAPEDRLLTLLPRLAESELGRAIVLDGVHLAGIVSLTDVTRALEIRGLADPVTS